jgi:hypothetical protein
MRLLCDMVHVLVETLARPWGSIGPRCGGVGRVGFLSVVLGRGYGDVGPGGGRRLWLGWGGV